LSVGADARTAVLDASVALSWLIPDEGSGEALALRRIAVRDATVLAVPPTFWFEVANVLWVSTRRARIGSAAAHAALEALQGFGITTWACSPTACLQVSEATGLAVYDAAYVVVALDGGGTLWTVDRQMRQIAQAMGTRVLP
jgi:predicted nucleic acid-binding protein